MIAAAATWPGMDGPVVLYKVVFSPRVPCREQPSAQSRIISFINEGVVVETYDWDDTGTYRSVHVEDDAGEMQDAWMLVESETKGEFLRCIDLEEQKDTEESGEKGSADSQRVPSWSQREGTFTYLAKTRGISSHVQKSLQNRLGEMKLPPKASACQRYQVVYRPQIAVRDRPSKDAKVVRALKHGSMVDLFEWDYTRNWRRITVEAQVQDEAHPEGWLKLQKVDCWVLVKDPKAGPLLEAVFEDLQAQSCEESNVDSWQVQWENKPKDVTSVNGGPLSGWVLAHDTPFPHMESSHKMSK